CSNRDAFLIEIIRMVMCQYGTLWSRVDGEIPVRNPSSSVYIFNPLLYERTSSRESPRCYWRSTDCPEPEFGRSAGRSACHHGAQRLGQKHPRQSHGRPP